MKRNKLGVCTWIFGEMPLGQIAKGLRLLGYDGVELLGDLNRYPATEIRQLLTNEGLEVFSLTPLDVDLVHFEGNVRREALEYYFRLLEYSWQIGAPTVSCHGKVGKVRSLSSQMEEEKLFIESLALIVERAEKGGIKVALETLNRYESNLMNRAEQALKAVEEIGSPFLGILLDTYHMNIEEADLAEAIRKVGQHLFLVHVADSNRRAIGRGHLPFPTIFSTLEEIGYKGPIIAECTAPGPDPFTPQKGPGWEEMVWDEIAETIRWLKKRSWF